MRLTVSLERASDTYTAPLTSTRVLGSCLVAGRTLKDWQTDSISHAGLSTADEDGDLRVLENSWIAPDTLKRFVESSAVQLRVDDELLAYRASQSGTVEEGEAMAIEPTEGIVIRYPWQFLNLQERLLRDIVESEIHADAQLHERATIDGILILGKGSTILPGVYIEGVAVIGQDCKVGPNAYLRGMTSIGDGCHIGQAVEIKNSIIYGQTAMGHLSYCGDSVVGAGVNFGAGTIVSNFRHDGKNHRSMIGDRLVDTGRRKFGAIIGDGVHTGIHTGIYPGRKLWPETTTRPGDTVQRDLHSQEAIC